MYEFKLCEFATKLNESKSDWIYIGNFLDDFYRNSTTNLERTEMISSEPKWLDSQSMYVKAFCSAMVCQIAVQYKIKIPAWAYDRKYFNLKEPHFAMNAKGNLRLVLLRESPKHFRERNIFTTANVLTRV